MEDENTHSCRKPSFYVGVKRNRLGQNVCNDRGVISCFHKHCDFDMLLQVKGLTFFKTLIFILSALAVLSSLEDRYVRQSFS